MDETAQKIGAVNTIKLTKEGPIGYNTDAYGFKVALEEKLKTNHTNALVLGTGGASKAVHFILQELGIKSTAVSRTAKEGQLSYQELTKDLLKANP